MSGLRLCTVSDEATSCTPGWMAGSTGQRSRVEFLWATLPAGPLPWSTPSSKELPKPAVKPARQQRKH